MGALNVRRRNGAGNTAQLLGLLLSSFKSVLYLIILAEDITEGTSLSLETELGGCRDESENTPGWDFCLLVCPSNGASLYPGGERKEGNIKQTGEECEHKEPDTQTCLEKDPAKHLHLMLSSKCCKDSKPFCQPISP